MNAPGEAVLARPRGPRRLQLVIVIVVISLILLLFVAQAVADAYTNYLWYRSIHFTMIWRSVVETKVGLAAVFSGIFFLACWPSLLLVDLLSGRGLQMLPEHELVRRYQATFARYRVAVRTVVSFVLALAVGVGTSSQWQHWLLFLNGGSFGTSDPQFHRDDGFYVFRLPFLSFLVDWTLVALLVLLIITTLGYYLSGGIRTVGASPRVDSHVVAHLSFIVALMALVRAAAYVFVDRYALDLATNGIVEGADYTDVHVRLPAMTILAIVSMIGFALLAFNVYHRSVVLPLVAVGLWAFVAVVFGVIFPAAVQWLQVNPSQSTVELPYIERNIEATRHAYALSDVRTQTFGADQSLTASSVNANEETLNALPLWDPQVAQATFDNLQSLHGYYALSALATDRYVIGTGSHASETPVVIGTRDLLQSGEPRQTWVNLHLEYTHGYGVVLSPANTVAGASGQPSFAVSNTPVQSSAGAPKVSQPDIYFGDTPSTYVVVDTKLGEFDYTTKNGKSVLNHYHGDGGVPLSGFWQRAAYAMRFHDLNLLISKQITSRSQIIYTQDITARVQHIVPFLKVDSHPYPVIASGQLYWMVDCYTTTSYFPYSQRVSTANLPGSSGLQGSYNYVRDAVKAVVNAYTGRVYLYALDPSDPVLIAWEHAYPGAIQPLKDMAQLSPALLQHLRYPQDLLTVEATMYGRYRFLPNRTQAGEFYSAQNYWSVADASNGVPYQPTYELLRLPGQQSLSFVDVEPMVPQGAGKTQLLTGFLTASASVQGVGSVTAYELPRVTSSALGPALVADKIQQNPAIAKAVTLLGQEHSQVLLGPTLLVPIDDSLVYVQAIYVSSTERPFPALEYIATDFAGDKVGFATTLLASLRNIFGSAVTGIGPQSSETLTEEIEQDLDEAYSEYSQAVSDGNHFRLGDLQRDLQAMGQYLQQAHQLLAEEKKSGTGTKKSSTTHSSGGNGSGGGSTTTSTTSPSGGGGKTTTTTGTSTSTSATATTSTKDAARLG